MLFAKATAAGIRLSGIIEHPALVLVTCKSAAGERHVVPVDCEQTGPFSTEITLKGFQVVDCVGIPLLKTRKTLYINRPALNAAEIIDWFKAQGMNTMLAPSDMHVTIAYSKGRVDWEATGHPDDTDLEIEPDLKRSVNPLGEAGAIVMHVRSLELKSRWHYLIRKGATWDYPSYQPHITLTYGQYDASRFLPFPGAIQLGPERWGELDAGWSPTQKGADKRESPPKGYPESKDDYALPDTYEFPVDREHIRAAISYFSSHHFDSAEQKRSAANKIRERAKKYGVHVSESSDVAHAAAGT